MTSKSDNLPWGSESSMLWSGPSNGKNNENNSGAHNNLVERLEVQNQKQRESEENAVGKVTQKEGKELQVTVESMAKKREKVYKKINFNLKESSVPDNGSSLVRRLREKYKNDNSLEGTLLNNPQIQNLLGRIVGRYESERNSKVKERYARGKQKSDEADRIAIEQAQNNSISEAQNNSISEAQNNSISEAIKSKSGEKSGENIEGNKGEVDEIKTESREEFALRESTRQKFEDWLLSKDGVRALMSILDDHIDENGNLYERYPVSEKDLELKMGKAWITHLRNKYNGENHLDNQDDKGNKKELIEVGKKIQDGVNKAVKNHMLNEGTEFDGNMIKQLETCIGQEGNFLQELEENPEKRDEFKCFLREYIKNYSNLVLVKEGDKIQDVKLETGNDQIDLQLKSYLFIYGKTFLSEIFPGSGTNNTGHEYDESLLETLKIILSEDYEEIERLVKNKKLLEQEKREEEDRRIRDYRRRQDAARRNREYNSNYNSGGNGFGGKFAGQNDTGDGSNLTGVQLASRINLDDYNSQGNIGESFLNSDFAKEKAFNIAWKDFKESNKDIGIEDILTPEDMGELYTIQGNTIIFDEEARKEFLKGDTIPPEEIDVVYNRIKTFPDDFSKALKIIGAGVDMHEKVIDDHVKAHALGAVIDNVRYIFADIEKKWENMVDKWKGDSKFSGFKFDANNPVTREGDDIIMSGTFNGTAIKIRYDLTSGNLYMNSFLHYETPSKVSIGNTNEADLQIGHLSSFDSILNEYYQAPELSFSSGSQTKNRGSHSSTSQSSGAEQGPLKGGDSGDKSGEGKKLIHVANQGANPVSEQPTPAVSMPNVNVSSPSGAQSVKHSTSNTGEKNRGEIKALREKYSDMLNADLDMIGDMIMDNTKMQSAKNSSITKFMKTFNILGYSGGFQSVDFNEGSNLFRLVKIIDYTGDKQPDGVDILDYFENTFMPKAMEYSGLKWGENNYNQDKSGDLFTRNDNNKTTNILKSKIDNFNPHLFEGIGDFDSSHQLGFIDLITDNLLDKSQNTLDMEKMRNFTSALGGTATEQASV